MTDYERIKAIRLDMTEWVLHLTKSFDLLKKILSEGYLAPGFALRTSAYDEEKTERPTVRGPHPAVCFTDMPLWAAKDLTNASMHMRRYHPYGFAFLKSKLFKVGARPVIYGTTEMLGPEVGLRDSEYVAGRRIHKGGLPKGLQYLWVGYDLERQPEPADWTHEREWRCKVDPAFVSFNQMPGVPLELGTWVENRVPTFRILVKTASEEAQIVQLLAGLGGTPPTGVDPAYFQSYVARLKQNGAQILVLDHVVDRNHKTGRVETYF